MLNRNAALSPPSRSTLDPWGPPVSKAGGPSLSTAVNYLVPQLADISSSIKLTLRCNGALQAETQRLFFPESVLDGKYSADTPFVVGIQMMVQIRNEMVELNGIEPSAS